MTHLHAHMDSRSRDCDGPLDRNWVATMPDAEDGASDDDREFAFRRQVLASVVNIQPLHTGTLTVTSFEDGTSRLSWHEETDEGFHAVEATFCTDETCDLGASGQRDYYAEAMGY
jgi:hypothetical protein